MALQANTGAGIISADIVNKATGAVAEVSVDAIDLAAPSIVHLHIERASVASMVRSGDDLVLRLVDGKEIRIADFYQRGGGAGSDLVLEEADGQHWLAHLSQDGTRFTLIEDAGELVAAAGGSGGGMLAGSGLYALLGGVALAGGIAAAAGGGGGGGGGGDDSDAPGTTPDTSAPARPTAGFNTGGTAVTGTGEPGANVEVRGANGEVVGRGTVGADGNFSVPVNPPRTNGETVSVVQTDAAGNASVPATASAPDLTAPAAPTASASADGTSVSGTGEPGATVKVTDATGTVVASTTVAANGSYTVPLSPAQANGGTLSVVQTDAAGNASSPIVVSAPDLTAPAVPTATTSADGTTVSGTGEPGATVTVTDASGTTVAGTIVAADGSYVAPLSPAQSNGGTLTVVQTDPAGNASPPATINAPDLTAPSAPTATPSPDGTSIAGTGEPGATVTVTDATGAPVATATVAADGSYSAPLSPPQANGGALTVVQTDATGNVSPPVTVASPDVTAPGAPSSAIDPAGAIVSGTGEPGATVTVTGPAGAVLGTAVVAPDGSYTVPLATPLQNGEALQVVQTDASGNTSPAAALTAPDTIAPDAPTATLAADGTAVAGTGEPGAAITVTAADGTILGTATVAGDGSYSAVLTPAQIDSQVIAVVQTDPAGNTSPAIPLVAPDLTAPDAPVSAIDATGAVVTGTGEPGAAVSISDASGAVLATGVVNAAGAFALVLPTAQIASQSLAVTLTDAAGNVSPPAAVTAPDLTPPAATTATVAADGASATGIGEGGATVIVTDPLGAEIGRSVAAADGSYTVALTPAQINGETLSVTQVDAAGNVSAPTSAIAPDLVAGDSPDAPTAVLSADGATVTGVADPNATVTVTGAGGVVLGTATAAADGSYSVPLTAAQLNGETIQVVQADAEGDRSPPTSLTAFDQTAPAAPTAVLDGAGVSVTGTGEPGATITVAAIDGTVLGTAIVVANGSYTAVLTPAQVNGETILATQTDGAGNISPAISLVAPDFTAPAMPSATIDATGAVITGAGEPGAAVTVSDAAGTVLATGIVSASGAFAVVMPAAQIDSQSIAVTLTDAAGNVSAPAALTAPDLTPPAAATATVAADGASVTGSGEAGATVIVTDPLGAEIGRSVAAADGSYTVVLTPPQSNGETLTVTQVDAAGNASVPTSATAPDLVIDDSPDAPTATLSADGASVTGVADPAAIVTVTGAGGVVLGAAIAGADGSYTVALTLAQLNGETLQVVQADADGDLSPPTSLVASDLTAPAAPTAVLDGVGVSVSGTGEAGATITVAAADGTVLGTAVVAANGSYTAVLTPAQIDSQVIAVVQTDPAGNASPAIPLVAPDLTAPGTPVSAIDATGTVVTGTGEPGTTVTVSAVGGGVLATGVVNAAGAFAVVLPTAQIASQSLAVTLTDAAGNVSAPAAVTAPDLTPPAAATATVAADGASATGVGEGGATVIVTDPLGTEIGRAVAAADGSYTVALAPAQINGETLSVTQVDAAGNVSAPTSAIAPDLVAGDSPDAPTAVLSADGATVTGVADPNATVTVTGAGGVVLGTAIAGADGSYSVPLTVAQLNGETLQVVQADAEGDRSPPTSLTASDQTAPAAPTAVLDGAGVSVTGTGEPGATITVAAADGTVLGTAIVVANGSYTAVLTPAQVNGETILATQTDAAGNISPAISLVAPDFTAPAAPTIIISADGTVASGVGEPGATVTLTGTGTIVLGTAVVAADGTYSTALVPSQIEGQTVSASQSDTAGNASGSATAIAPDLVAPAAPTAAVAADGTALSGTGEPGANITVTATDGTVLGTAIVAGDGSYIALLTPAQVNNQTVSVVQTDAAGNDSPAIALVAPDLTAPAAPTIVIGADGTSASGVGEPGATVTIISGGTVLGTALVAGDGSYSTALVPPQVAGQTVSASQSDAAGNPSGSVTTLAPDFVAPDAPTAALAADGTSVTGTGEPGAGVSVTAADGTVLGTAIVAADGSYIAILTPAQINNQTISVVQTDGSGNNSPAIPLIAPDLTAPVLPVAAINGSGSVVTGTGEPGTTVTVSAVGGGVLATGVVNASGAFAIVLPTAQIASESLAVTLTDAAGNVSPPAAVTAPDLTPPAATTATVAADGASATGIGEGGATVIVTDPLGTEIGRAVAAADGSYTVALTPAQINGETLSVTQVDAAGNVSAPTSAIAPDLVAGDSPDAPTAVLSADGATVTGVADPNATVTVTGAGGVVLGTATAAADGSYSVPLTAAQLNGETIQVVQADAEGDRSPPTSLTASDQTAPAAPTAVLDGAGASVSGTGEPGATVTVAAADGTVLGTALVAANGSYTAILTTAQINGQALTATQSDAASNASPSIPLVAPDLVAPSAPAATLSPDGLQLTGTGEPGTNVTVTNTAGVVLGTGTVGIDGAFTVAVSPAQVNGQVLGVTLADGGGNNSPTTAVTAADTTAPAAPTITVSGDGTFVAGTGEPGAAVTITDPAGAVIGTATVTAGGTYTATLTTALVNGQLLTATQADAAGNPSPTATDTAPDLVAPLAPTATVSSDGTQVTGVGEPGATIVINDPRGTAIGFGQGGADGRYTITLTTPQANGQLLSAVQTDAGGNASPPRPAQAPDITPPTAPNGTVSANGTLLTGTGEPGAVVTITSPAGVTIGNATVAANGSFTALLTPAQTNGQTLGIAQRDGGGNLSPPASAVAPDLTAPGAPTATVSANGTSVTGAGEMGATVTVRNAAGTVVGTAVVGGDGTYTAPLSPPQANGGTLSVAQFDAAGNPSPATPAAAPDITPPLTPTASVSADGTRVTGTGEIGSTVTVTTPAGVPLGSAVVGAGGIFTVPLSPAQANGELVRVAATDPAGNASPGIVAQAPDITAPAAPVATVSPGGTSVTGTGEPGATVTVSGAGGPLGSAIVASDGTYTVRLSAPQNDGQSLTVAQSDRAGNNSVPAVILAPDGTPPLVPTATVNADGSVVTGVGVAGATITVTAASGAVLGTAVVGGDGTYSAPLTIPQRNGETLGVTQADGAGNVSPRLPVVAPDITAPSAPTLTVAADGTTVSGVGEPGATVTITAAGATIGTALVVANGTYFTTLTTPQANGGTLTATQADASGNISTPATAAAPDITPPAAPSGLVVSADGTIVTGTGEPSAAVTIRDASGGVIGSGFVGAGGTFSVGLTAPQVTGAALSATLTDAAGNRSPATAVTAPFDIDAFNNNATANIDLLPVTTAVTYGTANYTALVSLGLLDLQAQVLGTQSVNFTVQPGHTFNATFTYDALLSLGVASGYSVFVQRFDGTRWVAVEGTGNASLVQLGLLNGDLVATDSFGPGQYRAFLTFQGTAGLGLLGSLNVRGQDVDFTDIGGVTPSAVSGNVIADPGPSGEVDVVSPQTVVGSVTIAGVTTALAATGGTTVDGAFGTLVINRNGTYTYTPHANAGVIGQTEQITYTLFNPTSGELESATLSVAIGSGDVFAAPVAVTDSAVSTVSFQNVEAVVPPALEFGFTTPGALIFPVTRGGSDTFTVAANSTADVTITAVRTGLLSVLPTYTVTVFNPAGTAIRTVTQTALANLPLASGLLGAGISVTLDDLPAGTYSYSVSSTNTIGTAYTTNVFVGETTTFLDRFELSSSTLASGNLLANDTIGTDFPVVRVNTGASFAEVGDTPISVAGRFGTLTVDEVGNYTYRPSTTLAYSATDLVDSFTYELVQPNGVLSTATLNVTIDVPADGRITQPLAATAFSDDVVTLGVFDTQDGAVIVADVDPAADLGVALLAQPDELGTMLGAYLDQAEPAAAAATSDVHATIAPLDIATVSDPLDYLVLPTDLDRQHAQGGALY